jgi:hypothetical protein
MANNLSRKRRMTFDLDLNSPLRQCIELQIEHADLNALIDQLNQQPTTDELRIRRLKKRKLALRDEINRLQWLLEPKEPA